MEPAEIRVGYHYTTKIGGRLCVVKVHEIQENQLSGKTEYFITNLRTGQNTYFRSAAKFHRFIPDHLVQAIILTYH